MKHLYALFVAVFALSVWGGEANGQSIEPIGSDEALDVATWNIEWFGNPNGPENELQFANVRAIIEAAEIDLWAVQEISNVALFHALLDSLGDDFSGALATYTQAQKIGFVYRTAVVNPRSIEHILQEFADSGNQSQNYFAGRPPLKLEANVTLPDTTLQVVFVTLHMKCCADTPSYERRQLASQRLKTNLDFWHGSDRAVVLGDFNDLLTSSITPGRSTPYANFLADDDAYRFVTYEVEEAGETSFGSQSMIDHILITDELFGPYQNGTAAVWRELRDSISLYPRTTSDHYPVYASFRFATETSIEQTLPAIASISPPYPNPTVAEVWVDVTLAHASPVFANVYDVLGRKLATVSDGAYPAGDHTLRWDATGIAAGTYLMRVVMDGVSVTRPVLVR